MKIHTIGHATLEILINEDSITLSIDHKLNRGFPFLVEVLRDDCGKTVNYIPGMK